MNTKSLVLLVATLMSAHIAVAQSNPPIDTDVIINLTGSGTQTNTYDDGSGRTDVVINQITVNLQLHPYSPQANGIFYTSSTADFSGTITVSVMATETQYGLSDTDNLQDQAKYTEPDDQVATGFFGPQFQGVNPGDVSSLSLDLPTSGTQNPEPYALYYDGTNGILGIGISLPAPFSGDSDICYIPCTATVTGNGSSISGLVEDGSTKKPISGATVVIAGQTLTTGSDGSFFVAYIPPGSLMIQISAPGYAPYKKTEPLQPFSVIQATLPLTAASGALTGNVSCSCNGSSIAEALVTIGNYSAETDGSGNYSIYDIPSGTYTVTVTANNYVSLNSTITVVSSSSSTEENFALDPLPGLSALRVLSPIADVSPNDSLDAPIPPVTDLTVLAKAPALGLGVVADDVTPVLFQFSGAAADYTIQIAHNASSYNNGTLASHLFTLQAGQWSAATALNQSSFAGGCSAYFYLGGLTWTDFSGTPPLGVTVTVTVYAGGSASPIATVNFFVRPPPVILVHGIADDANSWSPAFTSALAQYRPPDFIVPINYGIGVTPLKQSWPSVWEAFDVLSKEVDVQLTSAESQIKQNWAFTRYDVVGHSQGGVLVRMLCQINSTTGTSAFGATSDPVVSFNNYYRGRFRRVITIGSPHNGTLLVWYLLQILDSTDADDKNLVSSVLSRMTSALAPFLIEKFDPFGPQIGEINNSSYPIDSRIRFNCIQTAISGGAPPIQTFNPLAAPGCYYLTGLCFPSTLSGESRGQVIIPNGSDGVVDYVSEGGGSGTIVTQITDNNIAHADLPNLEVYGLNLSFFGVPAGQSQTTYAEVGTTVGQLLNGSDERFSSFILPLGLTSTDEQKYSDSLALGVFVGNLISFLPSPLDESTNISLALQAPQNLSNAGPINWFAQTFGTNGYSTNGVTLTVNTNNSAQVTVSVDTTTVGQVVLYASYWASNGTFVIANPITVFSNAPGPLVGIATDPSLIDMAPGNSVSLNLWGAYGNGASNLLYAPIGAIQYTSSNTNVASIDAGGTITMISPGVASISASYQGFSAQTFVTSIAPFITSEPVSAAVELGSNALLTVAASGAAPLSYQWLFDGTPLLDSESISGSESNTLTIASVQDTNSGIYSLVVSNIYGSVTSSVAALRVALPPLSANVVLAGNVQLQFGGTAGSNYVLQYATNLSPPVVWLPFVTNSTDTNGNWTFTDTNAYTFPSRFFRIAAP
jgi:pimeloyl-ACP methyl ester carboxylesterase